jgi:hypothetical protein
MKVSQFTITFTSTLNEDTVPPDIASKIANLGQEGWDKLQLLAVKEMLKTHALPLINDGGSWAKIDIVNV